MARYFLRSVISFAILATLGHSHAANLFWDGTSTGPNAEGGDGVWDTVTTNWMTAASGGSPVAFVNNDTPQFGGAAGTVTNTGVTVGGMTFSTDGYLIQNGILTLGSNTITTNTGVTATISAALAGTVGLVKRGTGTLILSGNNTYSGTTSVRDGGTLSMTGGTLSGGSLTLGILGASSSGTGTFNISGGTVTLTSNMLIGSGTNSGRSTYTQTGGNVDLGANYIALAWNAGSSGGLNLSAGSLSTTGTLHTSSSGSAQASSVNVSGTGLLQVGTLSFGFGSTGAQSDVNLNGGTIQANQIVRVAGTGTLSLNGGTLRAGPAAGSSFFASNASITASVRAGGAKIDTNGRDVTIAQALLTGVAAPAVDGGLTKAGAGTLTLSGSSTYNGPTTISAGTLALGAAASLATSSIVVSPGATFNVSALGSGAFALGSGKQLGGAGTIFGDFTFGSGSKLAFTTTDTLTVASGTVSFFAGAPGSQFGIDDLLGLDATTPLGSYTLIAGLVDTTNLDNLGSGNAYSLGDGRSAYFESGSLAVVVVPEPASLSLVALGLAAVAAGQSYRRRTAG